MKRILSVIIALALCLALCLTASAENTRLVGHCGYNVDYPADLLTPTQYGLSAFLLPIDESADFNMQIRACEELTADPVTYLQQMLAEYSIEGCEVNGYINANGAQVWSVRYPLADSVCYDFILQQDGREFQISAYMYNSADRYETVVEDIVNSFAVDPNGDFSGYTEADEEEEEEPDFYTVMVETYDPVLRQVGTAMVEGWDFAKLSDNNMCTLLPNLTPDDVKVDFLSTAADGDMANLVMVLYTVNSNDNGVDLLSMYAQSGDGFICVLNSSERDLFTLMKDAQDRLVVSEDASNSAFQSGSFYYYVNAEAQLELIEGVVYDGEANAESPWFITHDTDWDVSNDTPCTEAEYDAVSAAYTNAEPYYGFTMQDYITVDMGVEPEEEEG